MAEFGLRAVALHLAGTVAAVPVLVVLDVFSLPLFYVVSLIGFLTVYELLTPVTIRPRWKRRLEVVAALWMVGFGVLVGWQISRIVSTAI
jgi:hypothetical protein